MSKLDWSGWKKGKWNEEENPKFKYIVQVELKEIYVVPADSGIEAEAKVRDIILYSDEVEPEDDTMTLIWRDIAYTI